MMVPYEIPRHGFHADVTLFPPTRFVRPSVTLSCICVPEISEPPLPPTLVDQMTLTRFPESHRRRHRTFGKLVFQLGELFLKDALFTLHRRGGEVALRATNWEGGERAVQAALSRVDAIPALERPVRRWWSCFTCGGNGCKICPADT